MKNTPNPTVPWKVMEGPVPLHSIQILTFDLHSRLLLMHRGPNVRSAKNIWSFPSGLHDIGETIEECVQRELMEEVGLTPITHHRHLGVYENIAPEPEAPWHWVLSVVATVVADLDDKVNKEPDKHDCLMTFNLDNFGTDAFYDYGFHKSFEVWSRPNGSRIRSVARNLIDDAKHGVK